MLAEIDLKGIVRVSLTLKDKAKDKDMNKATLIKFLKVSQDMCNNLFYL